MWAVDSIRISPCNGSNSCRSSSFERRPASRQLKHYKINMNDDNISIIPKIRLKYMISYVKNKNNHKLI